MIRRRSPALVLTSRDMYITCDRSVRGSSHSSYRVSLTGDQKENGSTSAATFTLSSFFLLPAYTPQTFDSLSLSLSLPTRQREACVAQYHPQPRHRFVFSRLFWVHCCVHLTNLDGRSLLLVSWLLLGPDVFTVSKSLLSCLCLSRLKDR